MLQIDQLLAAENTTTDEVYWPLADHLGTVRDIVSHDESTPGTTSVSHRVYDAFGNLKIETGPVAITDLVFGYTGRMFDSDTGLQNNLNRWYDAPTGRWLSEDPIGFAAGDANLYRYVGNGTPNASDPSGQILETVWDVINVGVGVVSLCSNIATGNVAGALVDAAGIVIDAGAVLVPGVPGGAGTAIKTVRLSKSSLKLAENMLDAARRLQGSGHETVKRFLRYTVTEWDEAHHIIPRGGPPHSWSGGTLRKAMDELRQRATAAGIDIEEGIENGVALAAEWHKRNTLDAGYYQRIVDHFADVTTFDGFIAKLNEMADVLMLESGKLR